MHELPLKVQAVLLHFLLRRYVVDESDKARWLGTRYGANREESRKHAAVFTLSRNSAAFADDMRSPSGQIPCQVAIVRGAVRLGHQHPHIATHHL